MSQTGDLAGALNSDGLGSGAERGSRRKKLAGYLKAANELRQSYQNAYIVRGQNDGEVDEDEAGIPGAFPEMVVARSGVEEMVLFPSYARRRVKQEKIKTPKYPSPPGTRDLRDEPGSGDAEFWRKEWEIYEDANAVVDVDIRGWMYSPHTGPMTRKNRLLFGIARHLSGIPAPPTGSQSNSRATSRHREKAAQHEEELVEREARQISQRGRREADVAGRGGYSEGPDQSSVYSQTAESRSSSPGPGRFGSRSVSGNDPDGDDAPGPGHLDKRASWNQPADMSPAELLVANGHLLARLKPFLTNPSVGIPLTIFFYNDHTSQSRTTTTNEAGHFNCRAALEFVPTHVRVLASESLSATEEVIITEPRGVSLISDIDDTIKHSSIGRGAKEIFRNTFIRDLGDLTIDGVKEWYNKMSDMGVKLHYVSNSPWQLYPVLVSFFAGAGLPKGSFHLKQYSGMLQGIFEPVAERKKGTLDRILRDFPDRRFILVGDSGEADLELYTDIVLAYPGRILAVFIRDVTTSPTQGFFDPSSGLSNGGRSPRTPARTGTKSAEVSPHKDVQRRPVLPPRPLTHAAQPNFSEGPRMGRLIDIDDDDEPKYYSRSLTDPLDESDRHNSVSSFKSLPPNRPSKPEALRGISGESKTLATRRGPPRPPKPRKLSLSQDPNQHPTSSPLSQTQNAKSPASAASSNERHSYKSAVKSRVTSAYNHLPSPTAYWNGTSHQTSPQQPSTGSERGISTTTSSSRLSPAPPPPPRRGLTSYPAAAAQYATNRLWSSDNSGTDDAIPSPVNKKEEMWKRRWRRAKVIMDDKGVLLKAWRVGGDVEDTAVKLVGRALKEDD